MIQWIFNAYLDKCLDIIFSFDEFVIKHLPREKNGRANALAQQASDYKVEKKIFNIRFWMNRSDRSNQPVWRKALIRL